MSAFKLPAKIIHCVSAVALAGEYDGDVGEYDGGEYDGDVGNQLGDLGDLDCVSSWCFQYLGSGDGDGEFPTSTVEASLAHLDEPSPSPLG